MKNKKFFSVVNIICVVCILIGIACGVMISVTTSHYESEYNANNVQIGDLQDAFNKAKAAVDDMDDVVIVEANLESCADVGREVADLQTKYQTVSGDAVLDNALALDIYFDETSKNSRVPWFATSNPETVSFTWEFQSTYDFASKQVDVLWLCYENDSDNLLAYAVGIYNTESGLFSDVSYHMTTVGSAYVNENPNAYLPGGSSSAATGDASISTDETNPSGVGSGYVDYDDYINSLNKINNNG